MEMENREVQRASERSGQNAERGGPGHSRALAYMQCDDTPPGSDAL